MSTSNAAASAPNAVWAEHAGTRQYIGHNSSSAEVRIDMGPGEFSPGELMKIALVACNTLSADHRLAKALGESFEAAADCSIVKNDVEEHYESFQIEIVTGLSLPDARQRGLLSRRVAGAANRHYTVGHTVGHGASYTTTIVDPSED